MQAAMASSFGLELSYRSVLPSITRKSDVLVVLVHWKLVSNGYLCFGLETEVDPVTNIIILRNINLFLLV